jgi:hypothetical protein
LARASGRPAEERVSATEFAHDDVAMKHTAAGTALFFQ